MITTKDALIEQMLKLYENMHKDAFSVMPLTFLMDLSSPNCQQEFDKFQTYFNILNKYKE